MGVVDVSDNDERLDRLLDDSKTVNRVDNRDLRWMILLLRKDFQMGLNALAKTVSTQEDTAKALTEHVQANTAAVNRVQQAHDGCPLSDREGRDAFVSDVVRNTVRDAVQEANGTKPMLGPLSRGEAFQVMGWVIMALVVALVFLATKGNVIIPLP